MNCYQQAMLRYHLRHALRVMGGVTWVIRREELDLNGIPTGRVLTIGHLYGLRYTRTSQIAGLTLGIPGVAASGGTAPRVVGIMEDGTAPQAGDRVERVDGGASEGIVMAESYQGVLYVTLAGDNA